MKRQLVVHGDYISTAKYRTNIPDIFRGIIGVFRGISHFLFTYLTISCCTPNNFLRNPGRGTLIWGLQYGMDDREKRGYSPPKASTTYPEPNKHLLND